MPCVGYFGWLGVTSYLNAASASRSEHEYLQIEWDAGLEVPISVFPPDQTERRRLQRVSRVAKITGLPEGLVYGNLNEVERELDAHIQELCASARVAPLCEVRAFDAVSTFVEEEAFQKRSQVLARWLANHPYNKNPLLRPLSIDSIKREERDARDMLGIYERARSEAQSNFDTAITYGLAFPVSLLLLFPCWSYIVFPVYSFILRGFRPVESSSTPTLKDVGNLQTEQLASSTVAAVRAEGDLTFEAHCPACDATTTHQGPCCSVCGSTRAAAEQTVRSRAKPVE